MTVLVRSRAGRARLAGSGDVLNAGGPAVALTVREGRSVRLLSLAGHVVATGGEVVQNVDEQAAALLVARGIAEAV